MEGKKKIMFSLSIGVESAQRKRKKKKIMPHAKAARRSGTGRAVPQLGETRYLWGKKKKQTQRGGCMGAKQRGTGRDMAPRPRLGVPCRDRSRWRGGSRQCRGGGRQRLAGRLAPSSFLPPRPGGIRSPLPALNPLPPPNRHASFVSVFKMNDY